MNSPRASSARSSDWRGAAGGSHQKTIAAELDLPPQAVTRCIYRHADQLDWPTGTVWPLLFDQIADLYAAGASHAECARRFGRAEHELRGAISRFRQLTNDPRLTVRADPSLADWQPTDEDIRRWSTMLLNHATDKEIAEQLQTRVSHLQRWRTILRQGGTALPRRPYPAGVHRKGPSKRSRAIARRAIQLRDMQAAADEFGMTRQRVQMILQQCDLLGEYKDSRKLARQRARRPAERIALQTLRRTHSVQEAAAASGLSASLIGVLRRKEWIPTGTYRPPQITPAERLSERDRRIIALRNQGVPDAEILAQLGLPRHFQLSACISQLKKRLGIDVAPATRRPQPKASTWDDPAKAALLGTMPDRTLGKQLGVSGAYIQRVRQERGIAAFRHRQKNDERERPAKRRH